MKRRRNKNLNVVKEPEDPTDKIVEDLIKELKDEDIPMADPNAVVRELRNKRRRRYIISVVLILIAVVGLYLFINLQTYNTAMSIRNLCHLRCS